MVTEVTVLFNIRAPIVFPIRVAGNIWRESLEELEELERLLPLCRKTLYEAAKAKLETGTARTGRETERQLAAELGRSEETIHSAIGRERKAQLHKLGALHPPCEKDEQGQEEEIEHICGYCCHYDCDREICWLLRDDTNIEDTCDNWQEFPEEESKPDTMCQLPHVAQSTGENEWYTPPGKYLARKPNGAPIQNISATSATRGPFLKENNEMAVTEMGFKTATDRYQNRYP